MSFSICGVFLFGLFCFCVELVETLWLPPVRKRFSLQFHQSVRLCSLESDTDFILLLSCFLSKFDKDIAAEFSIEAPFIYLLGLFSPTEYAGHVIPKLGIITFLLALLSALMMAF